VLDGCQTLICGGYGLSAAGGLSEGVVPGCVALPVGMNIVERHPTLLTIVGLKRGGGAVRATVNEWGTNERIDGRPQDRPRTADGRPP
jgi:hypothetical protein